MADEIKEFNMIVDRLTSRYFGDHSDFETMEQEKENKAANIFTLQSQTEEKKDDDVCEYAESPNLEPSPVAMSCCKCVRFKKRVMPQHG